MDMREKLEHNLSRDPNAVKSGLYENSHVQARADLRGEIWGTQAQPQHLKEIFEVEIEH
jgi:hypothetical protein